MHDNRDFQSDFNHLRRVATDRCGEIAVRLLGNPSIVGKGEMRWGRKGSRSLKLRDGLWYDHENAHGGDIIDLIMEVEGCSFGEACDWLRIELGQPKVDGPWRIKAYREDDDLEERIDRARSCYADGKPASSEGRDYFEQRGLDWYPHVERQMRVGEVVFRDHGRARALLMPFRDCATHEITGVHRIGLDAFTLDGHRIKRSVGRVKGSAMMIAAPGQPGPRLAVCEGLETAVGAIQGGYNLDAPVWALSGASFLAVFEPVPGVENLVVLADNDEAGRRAASVCAKLWREHAEVTIIMPKQAGTDFADEWRPT